MSLVSLLSFVVNSNPGPLRDPHQGALALNRPLNDSGKQFDLCALCALCVRQSFLFVPFPPLRLLRLFAAHFRPLCYSVTGYSLPPHPPLRVES